MDENVQDHSRALKRKKMTLITDFKMKSSRQLSTFHSCLHPNSWLFDFKAGHLLLRGVHEFSAQLWHTASLLIYVQIQKCTSLLSLQLCCLTIPLIWGKLA